MPKEQIPFEDFLAAVAPEHQAFAMDADTFLARTGCTRKIENKPSGYLVSYSYAASKRVFSNFVFRKSGLVVRVYGDCCGAYPDFLETLPESMQKVIAKASACKNLLAPGTCSPYCKKGYDFELHGERNQKCRFNCFLFPVTDESKPFLLSFLEHEARERGANAN